MPAAATDLEGVLALMRCALGFSVAAQDLRALTAADPAGIVGIASAHAVMPLLAAAFENPAVREHIPEDLALFLQSMQARNAARNAALKDQLAELGDAFSAAGFHGVVLKGGADLLAPLYPTGSRFVLDLDILITEDRLDEAARICRALGYDFADEESNYLDEHHLPALLHPHRPALVELHRRISSERGDAVLPAVLMLQRAPVRRRWTLRPSAGGSHAACHRARAGQGSPPRSIQSTSAARFQRHDVDVAQAG